MLLLTSFVVKQVPSQTPPEVNATKGPVQQPPGMVAPNMSAPRPQPPPPFAPAPRGFPPQQAPNAPPFPRPPPGVQWDKPAPPQGQPLRPVPDSSREQPPRPVPDSSREQPLRPIPDLPREPSAIDKKWGVLFDRDGVPTKRWDQVVRGIGNYLVSIFSGEKEYQLTSCCRWMSSCRRIR
jgi:hypothetical protein